MIELFQDPSFKDKTLSFMPVVIPPSESVSPFVEVKHSSPPKAFAPSGGPVRRTPEGAKHEEEKRYRDPGEIGPFEEFGRGLGL